MNATGFLRKLSKIEQDPYSIWDAVNTVYGEGFFTKIIEKEYGINSATYISMNERIIKKTAELRSKHEFEKDQLCRQYEGKISELQNAINSKQLEINMVQETWERDETTIKTTLTQEIKAQFDKELAERFKDKDDQMTELYHQINDLDEALEQYKQITMNYYEACEEENWDGMRRINQEIRLNKHPQEGEGEGEGTEARNILKATKRISTLKLPAVNSPEKYDHFTQTDEEFRCLFNEDEEIQTDKIEILVEDISKENLLAGKKTKFKSKRLSNKRSSAMNSERDSKKLLSSVEDSNVKSSDRLEDEYEQNTSYVTKPVNKSLIGEVNEDSEGHKVENTKSKRIRDIKICHSSYTRRGKKSKGKENANEFQISYYDLPKVFSRLWIDAENKNERLREIQVKRINRSKEELEIIRNPHPFDHSSPHINIDDLNNSELIQRRAMENQVIQSMIYQNLQTQGYQNRNDARGKDQIYPNLLSNIACKTKDIIKHSEGDDIESPLALRENKYEQRRMSGPNNQNDSQISSEYHPQYHSSIKGIISATCKFGKHRNKSTDKQKGPAIKRNTNFSREIKVVPYNISTIENLITKNCFVEVISRGIQADGVNNEMQDIYSSHFFLTRKAVDDNLESIQRRKIPIQAQEDIEVYSTEENIIMNPIDDLDTVVNKILTSRKQNQI